MTIRSAKSVKAAKDKSTKAKAAKDEKVLFIYSGVNKDGRKIKGQLAGPNIDFVKNQIKRQGVVVSKIKKKRKPKGSNKVGGKEISIFSRQMATMMDAGVPLSQALEIIGRGHENEIMRRMIMDMKASVEGGSDFSEALSKHPRYFDELFVNLVEAGEKSGTLDDLLGKIALYKEKLEEIKAKIKKAMFYPAAVLVVAFIVSTILLLFVVPQFEEMFSSFGADLPAFTMFIIGLSDGLQANWFYIFGGIAAAIYAFIRVKRTSEKFRRFLDRVALKLPVVGELNKKASVARFARTLSTMFAAGVPLVEALESVSGATGNSVYTDGVLQIRDDVSTGIQLQTAMQSTALFENMDIQMIAIGEESGALETMLDKVAQFYEAEVDNMVDSLSSLMEPLIMAVLGVVVGGLVIAMYLPIFKLGSVV